MTELVSQRLPEKMSTDRAAFDALCAGTVLAHVGVVVDGRAKVFPTGFAVLGDELVIHGSTGSRWMRALVGHDASVTITKLDGVMVARSTFESSMLYRSAMVFGRFEVAAAERQAELLNAMSDRIIPGRSAEVRASSKRELAATMALVMPLREWSLRVSDGWPEDDDADLAGDAWAGVVRFGAPPATADAAPDLRDGIPVPDSVAALVAHPEHIV